MGRKNGFGYYPQANTGSGLPQPENSLLEQKLQADRPGLILHRIRGHEPLSLIHQFIKIKKML